MIYMLDTNICIYAINKKPASYLKRLNELKENHNITISSIVLSELQYGVCKSKHQDQNQSNLDSFLSFLEIIDYSARCALYYGQIKAELTQNGIIIGGNDLLIASHALCEEAILVTNNHSEFKRVPNLKIETWDHSYDDTKS